MTFYAENETNAVYPFDYESVVRDAAEAVLAFEHCPYETEINLLITDKSHIREYNSEFRGIDAETDVLSFPAVDFLSPCDFSIAEQNKNSYFNPETGELILGDIIICHDRIVSQAEQFGHSLLREFTFLIVHSMLHLLGYDHMTEQDEKIMFDHQALIMDRLGITR